MKRDVLRQCSVTGRSGRSVGLSRFPLTGHCRRGSNFVIFPASKLGTSHSRVTISFRRCPSAAQRELPVTEVSFLVSQFHYFCGRSTAVQGDPLRAQSPTELSILGAHLE